MAIAFDLDGTLAEYDGWKGVDHIGPPIPAMIAVLREHIAKGDECIIFTARVSGEADERALASHYISKWLRVNDLPHMQVTATKYKKFTKFYDDRAFHVVTNTGRIIHP